jgi:hypothetical protein
MGVEMSETPKPKNTEGLPKHPMESGTGIQMEQALDHMLAQEQADIAECLKCGAPLEDNARFCDDCAREEEFERERNQRPQTLADVGMCEADFR